MVWRCPLQTVNAGGSRNSSDGYCLFDHCAGRNATWLLTCISQMKWSGQCCGREVQCGWRRTKRYWTKTAHNIRICVHLGLLPTYNQIYAHTIVCLRVEHWAYWRPQPTLKAVNSKYSILTFSHEKRYLHTGRILGSDRESLQDCRDDKLWRCGIVSSP